MHRARIADSLTDFSTPAAGRRSVSTSTGDFFAMCRRIRFDAARRAKWKLTPPMRPDAL
jgi:hypothetical protein